MSNEQHPIRILLACGIGASTGFMAAQMRKSAKQKGLAVTVAAASKAEIMDHADRVDVILLGPHFAAEVPAIQKQVASLGVAVDAIKPQFYAALDGESIIAQAIEAYRLAR